MDASAAPSSQAIPTQTLQNDHAVSFTTDIITPYTIRDRRASTVIKTSSDADGRPGPTSILAVEEEMSTVEDDQFPEGGMRAWSVVAGAMFLLFPSFGFQVSIGSFQDYINQHQLSGYSARDVGWIPSIFVYLGLSLGICVGPLFDRFGPRYLTLVGSILYVVMMFLLAECKLYWQFVLCCGFLGGIAAALLVTTAMAAVSHWFKVRRGLAQGITMIGSSFGGLTIPIILRTTLPKYGYQRSIQILAFMFTACLIIGNFLLKARIKPSVSGKKQPLISLSIFADLRFSLLAISVFGFEVVLFGSLGIIPTYTTLGTNFPADTGFYLIATMNGVSCIGRLVPGYVADKYGRFNTLWISLVFTLTFMIAIWLPLGTRSLPALYIFTALFGFGTGCWMALTPACIGQLCRAEDFGRYYGTLYFVASLSTLVCIPISGELVQAVGPQAMVGFYCIVLFVSIISFTASRSACLGWQLNWRAVV